MTIITKLMVAAVVLNRPGCNHLDVSSWSPSAPWWWPAFWKWHLRNILYDTLIVIVLHRCWLMSATSLVRFTLLKKLNSFVSAGAIFCFFWNSFFVEAPLVGQDGSLQQNNLLAVGVLSRWEMQLAYFSWHRIHQDPLSDVAIDSLEVTL